MKNFRNIKRAKEEYLWLLRMYYHASSNRKLLKVFWEDVLATVFLFSGSGFFLSIIKGLLLKFFIKTKGVLLVGRRFKIIHPSAVSVGKNVWFKDDVTIFASGKVSVGNNCVLCERISLWSGPDGISIGNNVWINMGCYLAGTGGPIKIGNDVLIADSVRMYTLDHKYGEVDKPVKEQGVKRGGIFIEDNVWIGSGVLILKGVSVGKGSVVAAGAVVTKDIPEGVLVAGVPAKIIKRFNKR